MAPTSSHIEWRTTGINCASMRSQSASRLRSKTLRPPAASDRTRPMTPRACPMNAFTNRFSGVSMVARIRRSDTSSGSRPLSRSASCSAAGESEGACTSAPKRVAKSSNVRESTRVSASTRTSRRSVRQRRWGARWINSSAGISRSSDSVHPERRMWRR